MRVHILIDNLPSHDLPLLHHEHGLCLLISISGKNYLIDTGASGKNLNNLELLREDNRALPSAEEIDGVIISHGHNDHTGGLRSFFESNTTAPVYLHSGIQGNWFFSCRPKNNIREARSIGMEHALFAEYPHRFNIVDKPVAITPQITLLTASEHKKYTTPMGNEFLYMNDFPDNFSHELITLIEYSPSCYAVISPCSHNGILNILDACSEYIRKLSGRSTDECFAMIKYFIGGLHYVDYLKMEQGEKETASIIETANLLKKKYPYLNIFSGHCTCQKAGETLKEILKGQYNHFCTGTVITTPNPPIPT